MKKSISLNLFLLLSTIFLLNPLYASHDAAVDISFECINSCTTRIHLKVYRDCHGIEPIPTSTLGIDPVIVGSCQSGAAGPVPIGPWSPVTITEVSLLCPTGQTECSNISSQTTGIEENHWYRDFNFCAADPNCTWKLSWSDCCRNFGISSINLGQGSAIGGMYVEMLFNIDSANCNNSPVFSNVPFYQACIGDPFQFNLGGHDPEGDSLVYSLATCMYDSVSQVIYNAGYSLAQPLGSSWNIQLDTKTGTLHGTPNPGNVAGGVFRVLVDEYRNGIWLAQYARDVEIIARFCSSNLAPVFPPPYNLLGQATVIGDTIYTCGAVCFDLSASDPNTGDVVTLGWDKHIPGASFIEVGNPSVTDTITGISPTGRFCFNPPVPGEYHFLARARDDNCPLYQVADRFISIVKYNNSGSVANAAWGGCMIGTFQAFGCGGSGNYTYSWSGSGGLASSNASFSHIYPSAGTYTWQVIISDGAAQPDTFSGTLTVQPTPTFFNLIGGTHTISSCNPQPEFLNAASGYSSYVWTQGSNTIANTRGTYVTQPGWYTITAFDASGCMFRDSINVTSSNIPDVYGTIKANATTPLNNQKVYLLTFDSSTVTLKKVDSTLTSATGYYSFCPVTDSLFYIKVVPDSGDYPKSLPTYADTTLFWNFSRPFKSSEIPVHHNFITNYGWNSGGICHISGQVTKGPGTSTFVAGLNLFLIDSFNGDVIDHEVTDANGKFHFARFYYGDYYIKADYPYVTSKNDSVPLISVPGSPYIVSNVCLKLHPRWLERCNWLGIPDSLDNFGEINISPNPFVKSFALEIDDIPGKDVEIMAITSLGRIMEVKRFESGSLGRKLELGSTWPGGLYYVQICLGNQCFARKVIKITP
ncbi:MAG: PKD domain-containing protein [Bacteroidia bacterium]|nr:PKD domain-containing protein [Bacteroidia bacterium]